MPAPPPHDDRPAHRLPQARDWQHRPELERLCQWWRGADGAGVCALVDMGGAGKTAVINGWLCGIEAREDVAALLRGLAPMPFGGARALSRRGCASTIFRCLSGGLTIRRLRGLRRLQNLRDLRNLWITLCRPVGVSTLMN